MSKLEVVTVVVEFEYGSQNKKAPTEHVNTPTFALYRGDGYNRL
jgi:hypothetical protein